MRGTQPHKDWKQKVTVECNMLLRRAWGPRSASKRVQSVIGDSLQPVLFLCKNGAGATSASSRIHKTLVLTGVSSHKRRKKPAG